MRIGRSPAAMLVVSLAWPGSPLAAQAGLLPGEPLPADQAFVLTAQANSRDRIEIDWRIADGYYLYRHRMQVQAGTDFNVGTLTLPEGHSHRDEFFGDVEIYRGQWVAVLSGRAEPGVKAVTLQVKYQGCADFGLCYPVQTRTLEVALPATPDPADGNALSPARLPVGPLSGNAITAVDSRAPGADPGTPVDNILRSPRSPETAGAGGGLAGALLLALLGGMVLNLMPCVLPILSLKALGLAHSGESRERARSHALWYALGVLLSFAAIGGIAVALRASGQALGWGFQLQQPWFVAALVYLLFAIGLSLSGVFTLGGGIGNVGNRLASKSGPAGDFFTGVLACLVASPCIAPFMGGALAYAFASSAFGGIAVFLALGFGLALPLLLIGLVPALADRLPKPGAWMETLKQVLAFPMYLTAIWLLWVLGRQRGVDAMALVAVGLAVFALALWWFERKRWGGAPVWRVAAVVLAVAALWPMWRVMQLEPPATAVVTESADRVAYSAEKLQALRDEGRVVFVDMAADWCVTCKANEKAVLNREPFRNAMREAGGVLMVGDWTNEDPAITAFLEKYKAVGVPLYVVFPRSGGKGEVLPTVLTNAITRDALARAAL